MDGIIILKIMALGVLFPVLIVLVIALHVLIIMLVEVIRIGPTKWNQAKRLSGSFRQVLCGDVPSKQGDWRVKRGQYWDHKKQQWVQSGQLSKAYLDALCNPNIKDLDDLDN